MVTLGVGTEKGAFFLRGEGDDWRIGEPVLAGWRVTTFGRTPSGDHLMATGSSWYGAALHRSKDLGDWEQVVDGPAWAPDSDRKLNNIWAIATHGDIIYAGVDEAGLFRSDDDGESWHGLEGLNEHETRPGWTPGFGGLAAHRILVDPVDPDRMWVGVSAVGVFHSPDGGASWALRNGGVDKTAPSDDFDDIGYCVHRIVADPADAEMIWRQDHQGVYRTDDGGRRWERIEDGLPAGFGFPMVRDHDSGALFVVPQQSDEKRLPVEGRFRVYRSTDGGDSWHESGSGHPEGRFYGGVLRDAMDGDGSGGVYLGTTSGTVHVTADAGENWHILPHVLPRILSVRVLT